MNFYLRVYFIFLVFYFHSNSSQYAITNPNRSDGFGAQFQTIIYSVIAAELQGIDFVYTPFHTMEHNYDNDPDFISKKEWLINFIGNFEINKGDAVRVNMLDIIKFFEANLTRCVESQSLKRIKRIFRENKDKSNYFDNNYLNIVIHIRRSNIHDNRIEGSDVQDDIFLHIIEMLRIAYASKNPLFHIHSQGHSDNFKKFNAPDIMLHLNESIEDSFTAMVLADVLVTSPSSFSYTAGILSEGDIYYIPFWHPPLPEWTTVIN